MRLKQIRNIVFLLSIMGVLLYADKLSFDKTLSLHGIGFHVTTTGEGSLRLLSIVPSGLEIDNSVISQEIEGVVTDVEVGDLNADASPEIYIYIASAGSGSYGNVIAYSANHNKTLSRIFFPELDSASAEAKGYMGHDSFGIVDSALIRNFPIYKKNDTHVKPTGGTRQLIYKLQMGEASWQLKLEKIFELKKGL